MLEDLKFNITAGQTTGSVFGKVKSDLKNIETSLTSVNSAAARTDGTFRKTGRGIAYIGSGTELLGKSSARTSNSMRMLTMQLSQVGQQTMAGGGFMRALAIQLPDIGLAFGAVGTTVGLLAGLALPTLAQAFGGAGDEAEKANSDIKDLSSALSALDDAASVSGNTIDAYLNVAFRESAGAVRELLDSLRDARFEAATSLIKSSVSDLTGEVDNMLGAWDRLNQVGPEALRAAAAEGNSLAVALMDLTENTGLTESQLDKVKSLLTDIGNSTSTRQLTESMALARQELTAIGGPVATKLLASLDDVAASSGITETIMGDIRDAAGQIAPALSPAIGVASALADELGRAFASAQSLANQSVNDLLIQKIRLDTVGNPVDQAGALAAARFDAQVNSGVDIGLQNAAGNDDRRSTYINNQRQIAILAAQERSMLDSLRSTGGASGGAAKEVEQFDKALAALRGQLDPTYKSTQDYEKALLLLNDALAADAISQTEFTDLVGKAQVEFLGAADGLSQYADQAGDFMADFGVLVLENIDTLSDLKSAVGDFVKSALLDLARLAMSKAFSTVFSTLLGGSSLGGSIGGSLFGAAVSSGGGGIMSMDGGGFTGRGARSGGIDGRGGFPAILHPNETVIDHTRGQGMGGGLVVNINGNIPRQAVRQSNGRIDIEMGLLVQQVIANGGADTAMRQRFGVSPRGGGV